MSSNWNPTAVSSDICIQLDDLLNDYAFGTLDPATTNFVAEHLAECPEATEILAALESSVDVLGVSVLAAPVDGALWQRISAEISPVTQPVSRNGSVASTPAPTPLPARNVREFRVPRWLATVAALLLVALTASTLTLGYALRNQPVDNDAMESTMAQYMTSGGNVTQLSSYEVPGHEDWWGKGALLTAPDMPPILILNNCEAMNKDKNYVVWLEIGSERTGMGQIWVDDQGRGMMTITGIDSIETYDMIGVSVKMDDGEFLDLMEGSPHQDI